MKLIVGLGNPGREYEKTRHNVGFMVIDKLIEHYNCNNMKSKFGGLYSETTINNEKVIFLKPQEYINLSGIVIKRYVDYFKIDISDILVINDDLDLKTGSFKIKMSGSSGGHNGLKNIEFCLGPKDYKRIKIGISNNKQIDTKDYVLGKIDDDDMKLIKSIVEMFPTIINDYFNMSFSNLMTKYNKKN